MRRFVGTVLIGLGVLLIVVAVGLPFYVAPAVTKLPYDMKPCPASGQAQPEGCLKPSVAEAAAATFLDKNGVVIRQGTLRSTTEVIPQPKTTADWQRTGSANRLGGNAIVWDVYGTGQWVEGNLAPISKYSTELALDRVSGAAIAWDAQWLDEENLSERAEPPRRNVEYKGQVYKFPFGTERKDYEIFDRDLRKALPAQFVEVTTVGDLEAYHFKQVIEAQEAQNVTPASLATLRVKFAPTATGVKVMYSNVREVWVDPVTGAYLNVREQPKKELVPNDGTDGSTTLLNADFKYTNDTVTNAVKAAQRTHSRLKVLNLYGPIGLGILGVLLVVGGFLLAMSRGRMEPTGEPGAWDATLPQPRHRLRGEAAGPDETSGPLTDTIPGATPTWSGPPRSGP
jgi:hypothetical protein